MFSSPYVEPEGIFSGRRLYIQVWYVLLYILKLLCALMLYYSIIMRGAKKHEILLECIGQWSSSGFLYLTLHVYFSERQIRFYKTA